MRTKIFAQHYTHIRVGTRAIDVKNMLINMPHRELVSRIRILRKR